MFGVGKRGRTRDVGQRKAAYIRGHLAEYLALISLLLRGWWPVARRYRTPLGEIDLVMRRGQTLAFIEVKYRQTREAAVEAVSAHSQNRIRRSASLFAQTRSVPEHMTLRFDVVLVCPRRWPEHLPNAF